MLEEEERAKVIHCFDSNKASVTVIYNLHEHILIRKHEYLIGILAMVGVHDTGQEFLAFLQRSHVDSALLQLEC